MDVALFANSPIGHLVPFRGVDGRNGVPYDHYAYVANPLGDEPELQSKTWHAVTAANRALARLDQASQQVPVPQLLRQPTLRREAQSTSALEGTFAPLEQVLAADTAPEESRSRELLEVMNYVEAADDAFNWVCGGRRITVGLLESIHRTLVRGTHSDSTDAGRVRQTPVVIGSPSGSIEEARFVPMPPGVALSAAMQSLVDWIATEDAPRDPVVAAALAHYQFETLHPFNDGNGRIGRLLIVLQLMGDELVSEPLLSVSPWFEARRNAYQDHLAAVSASGDWDRWIRFFAAGIEASAIDTARRVDRLLAVQQKYVEAIHAANGKGAIRDIAELLIGTPWVTVPRLTAQLSKTPPAVNAAVLRLVDLGILIGPIGTYNRQFFAPDVWETLAAPMGKVHGPEVPLRVLREAPAEGSPER